jgi:hypothetical protein
MLAWPPIMPSLTLQAAGQRLHLLSDGRHRRAPARKQSAHNGLALQQAHAGHDPWPCDVLSDGHVRIQHIVLKHHGHIAMAWRLRFYIAPADAHCAAVRRPQAGQYAQRGWLAAATRAEQPDELAAGHIEQDRVQHRLGRCEVLADALKLYGLT